MAFSVGLRTFRSLAYGPLLVRHSRCFHSSVPLHLKPSALKTEQRKLKGYFLTRFEAYVKNYEAILEKRFPSAMKVYRVFSIGIKDFYQDLKAYMAVRIKVMDQINGAGLKMLSRKEIEVYHQLPKDILKLAPVLIVSALPFANYVVFPLAYMKPRQFLTSHFWSLQQRSNFAIIELTKRLHYNRPVFRALQARCDEIKDPEQREKWKNILGMLGSGAHPSPYKVAECRLLFKSTYHLESLHYNHVHRLLQLHGLHRGFFRKRRLQRHAFLIHEMDKAIIREGGVANLPLDTLKHACFKRGLNAANINTEELRDWLKNWLIISKIVDRDTYSLLLHSPVLLAYNKPQNWSLIH